MLNPNSWFLLGWGAPSTELRVSFPSPGSPLKLGTSEQETRVQVRKEGSGTDPDVTLELFETGGTNPVSTLLAPTTISAGSGGQVVSAFWDAAALSDTSGASTEVRIIGTPRGGSALEVGALEWNARITTPITAGFIPASDEFFGASISAQGSNTGLEVDFTNPTRVLESGAGLQEFRVLVRKQGAGASHPTVSLELWEGTTKRADLVTNQSISSNVGTVVVATWNAASLVDSGGGDVRLKIIGTGVAEGRLEVGAVEWNAQPSEKGLVVAGFIPEAGDFYGASVYGDPVTVTAGFIPESSEFFGATVRGPVAQAGVIGEIAAGPFPVGKYTVGIDRNADMFGATLTTTYVVTKDLQLPWKILPGGTVPARFSPDAILENSHYSGVVGDIQDDPNSPDSNYLVVS